MKETKATLEMYAAKKRRDERLVTRNWWAFWTALSTLGFLLSVLWLMTSSLNGSSAQGGGAFIITLITAIASPLIWRDWRNEVHRAKDYENEYQEALDKAMPVEKVQTCKPRKRKKPKGGQD